MDLTLISEKEMIHLAQNGNEAAFAELYRHNLDAVYRYILKRVGEVYEAENITQTVFTKAWMALERYKPTAVPFRAWLYRIAHNAVVDYHRKRKDAAVWDELLSVPDTRHTPEELILSQERSNQVHAAMAEIKPAYQAVLSHRFLNEMDYAETAAVLERNVNAVRVLQHRALNALQKTLTQQAVTWIAMIAAIVSLGVGTQAIQASATALPGDKLYALKIGIEDTLLSLYDHGGDAQLYERYTGRRLTEIETLLDAGRLTDMQIATTRLTSQLAGMSTTLFAVAQDDPNLAQELASPMDTLLQQQGESLNSLAEGKSEQIQLILQPVFDAAENLQSAINEVVPNDVVPDEVVPSDVVPNDTESNDVTPQPTVTAEPTALPSPAVDEPEAHVRNVSPLVDTDQTDGADNVNGENGRNEAGNSVVRGADASANAMVSSLPTRVTGEKPATQLAATAPIQESTERDSTGQDSDSQRLKNSVGGPRIEANAALTQPNSPNQNAQEENADATQVDESRDAQGENSPDRGDKQTIVTASTEENSGQGSTRADLPTASHDDRQDEHAKDSSDEQQEQQQADRQNEPGEQPEDESRNEQRDETQRDETEDDEAEEQRASEPKDERNESVSESSSNDTGNKSKKN